MLADLPQAALCCSGQEWVNDFVALNPI